MIGQVSYLYGKWPVADQTVADVHVDGQHDLGANCDAQLFDQSAGVRLVLGHGHVELLSALVLGAVDCTDHSLLSWWRHLVELQHVLFVHVFVEVVQVQGVVRVVGIMVRDSLASHTHRSTEEGSVECGPITVQYSVT